MFTPFIWYMRAAFVAMTTRERHILFSFSTSPMQFFGTAVSVSISGIDQIDPLFKGAVRTTCFPVSSSKPSKRLCPQRHLL